MKILCSRLAKAKGYWYGKFTVFESVWKLYPRENPEPVLITFKEPRNRFQGIDSASLCSLAGRYNNPIPIRSPAAHRLF
jgi:hypothetical protein